MLKFIEVDDIDAEGNKTLINLDRVTTISTNEKGGTFFVFGPNDYVSSLVRYDIVINVLQQHGLATILPASRGNSDV